MMGMMEGWNNGKVEGFGKLEEWNNGRFKM
jgi:hypothetical protein